LACSVRHRHADAAASSFGCERIEGRPDTAGTDLPLSFARSSAAGAMMQGRKRLVTGFFEFVSRLQGLVFATEIMFVKIQA
jgi:hypothetical protein